MSRLSGIQNIGGCCSRALYNVVVHGFAFMALFTAFQLIHDHLVYDQTSGGFQTTVLKDIMDDSQLGTQSLAIIYAVFSLANFVSPIIVHYLGARFCMFLGGIGYSLFIGSILTLNAAAILSASALLGFSAAVIWTAQGNYITANTNPSTRPTYSGIFWAQLQSSLLVGNLMLFLIVHGDKVSQGEFRSNKLHPNLPRIGKIALLFYRILLGVAIGGTLMFLLTRTPPPKPFNEFDIQGATETDKSVNNRDEVKPPKSVLSILKSTLRLLVERDMVMLSFSIIYSGASLTYWSGVYPTLLGNTFKPQDIGLSGMIVGCAEIIGGVTFGRLGSVASLSWVVIVGLFAHASAFFLIYLNYRSDVFDPLLGIGLTISFLLGLGDSAFNNALYTILGNLFNDRSSEAFALFKFFQSAMAGIAFAYTGVLDLSWQLLILALLLLLGSYSFIYVDKKPRNRTGYHPIT
eukprot:gene9483-1724_t